MLRALRRVLRPGGRFAFTTIEIAAEVTGAARKRAIDAGARSASSRRPYPELLESAGFTSIGGRDASSEYLRTLHAWWEATQRRRGALVAVGGEDLVTERLDVWSEAAAVVERGWLRRTLYWAQRPVRQRGRS